MCSQEKIKIAYIRGWLDTEGYLEKWKKPKSNRIYDRVRFGCASEKITKWLKNEIQKFGIKVSEIWYNSKTYRFQITRKNSINLFREIINFYYPSKRELLRTVKVET